MVPRLFKHKGLTMTRTEQMLEMIESTAVNCTDEVAQLSHLRRALCLITKGQLQIVDCYSYPEPVDHDTLTMIYNHTECAIQEIITQHNAILATISDDVKRLQVESALDYTQPLPG